MEPISPPVPEARPLTVPEKERPDRRLSDVCPISPPTFSVPSTLPDTAQFRTSERMASPARMPTLGPADTEASSMVSPTTVAPAVAADLNVCSKRGLGERFDATVGANTVLMPLGGKRQRTPIQAMAAKIPLPEGEKGETTTCSVMAWGYDPFRSSASPYDGAYLAMVESLCRLAEIGRAHV